MIRVIKEVLFCALISIISILSIVLIGIIGLPKNAGMQLLLWITGGLLSYFAVVFIPFFDKKNKRYFDGLGLLFAYGSIALICLFRSESFDDYIYVSMLGFVGGIPFIIEIINLFLGKSKKTRMDNPEKIIIKEFESYELFDLVQITSALGISEYKAKKILNSLIEQGKILVIKKGNKNFYKVITEKNRFTNV